MHFSTDMPKTNHSVLISEQDVSKGFDDNVCELQCIIVIVCGDMLLSCSNLQKIFVFSGFTQIFYCCHILPEIKIDSKV